MLYSLVPKLAQHPLFKGVSQTYVNNCLNENNMSIRDFEANTLAFSSQPEPVCVGIIAEGISRVYANNGDDSTLLRTLCDGDIFGIANLYDESEPFPSKIITASPSKIIFIQGDVFRKFIEGDNVLLKNYLTYLTKKIIYLNKKIATFSAGSAEKKLSIFISEHITDNTFKPPCSMCELANMLGIGRASLYRAIDTLRQNEIIVNQQNNTFTINTEKLNNFNL